VTTPAEPPEDPLIGTRVDRYQVQGRLGDGGMGIVYKVEHIHLKKICAMKVMRPTRDAIDRQRFEQEARLASRIRHKNVVEILDFGVLGVGQPYFVMEFLRGQTLGDAIYEQHRLDALLSCHIAAQIASGLQAVHKQNVVHRDLKPDNIHLLDLTEPEPSGEGGSDEDRDVSGFIPGEVHFVKIMDFGIAKSVDNKLTGTGMTLGTPEYMSPEQATGSTLDWRSDQYSLGCMLYEMLTGELPFTGKGAFEIMQKHLNAQPRPLRSLKPELAAEIPQALEDIVLRMMQKKPMARFPSMRAVEMALRDIVAKLREESLKGAKTQVISAAAVSTDSQPSPRLPDVPRSGDDSKTVPLLQALPTKVAAPEPPAAATTQPKDQGLGTPAQQAKTLMMVPNKTEPLGLKQLDRQPPAGERGQTPTPRRILLDNLALQVRNSRPELPSPSVFDRIPGFFWLRGLVHRVLDWLAGRFRKS